MCTTEWSGGWIRADDGRVESWLNLQVLIMIEIVLEIDEKVEANGGLIWSAYGSTEGMLERPLLPLCLGSCMFPNKERRLLLRNGWMEAFIEQENCYKLLLLQTYTEITNHIVFNCYQSLFNIAYVNIWCWCRPLMRVVNQCEISHLWCQWESRH